MGKYKCVIFDCDGVLVDSESIAIGVLVDMANDLGAHMDFKESLINLKGKSLNSCMDLISGLTGRPIPEDFEKDYRANTFKTFKREVQPIKGIKEVLDNIELPFCVASSGPENKIRLNLEASKLLPYFGDNIFSCYEIKRWKPEPDIFLWAAEEMGFDPKDCLVIEDSLSGVKAAKAGGFDVFGYTEHDYKNELEALATRIFNNMDELLGMID